MSLPSPVGLLSILQAAFPLTTATQPVSNRRMYGCTRIEHRNGRQQRRPQRRARVEPQRVGQNAALAAMLAYNDVFRFLALTFVAMLPLLFLMRKPKKGGAVMTH